MRNWLRTPVVRYALLVFLGLVIGVNVYSLNADRLAGNAVPMPFGVGASVVLSGSMEPELSVGDLIILREASSYEEGDIVVYQSGSTPIVHRIIATDGVTAVTQGDANNAADDPIATEMVKGKVVLALPIVGYAVQALKSPVGITLTIAAAIALVELSFRSSKQSEEAETERLRAEVLQLAREVKQLESMGAVSEGGRHAR